MIANILKILIEARSRKNWSYADYKIKIAQKSSKNIQKFVSQASLQNFPKTFQSNSFSMQKLSSWSSAKLGEIFYVGNL